MIIKSRNLLITGAIAWFSIIAPAWAMECKEPTITANTTQAATDYTPLHAAAYIGCLECICSLVDTGADVNARATQHGGLTPLPLAVMQQKTNAITALVALGADPTITSDDNKTPLDLAQPSQQAELRVAIKHGLESRRVIQRLTQQMQLDHCKATKSIRKTS